MYNFICSRILKAIKTHPLRSYFIIAYLGSWIVSIPFILGEWGIIHGDYRIVFVLKAYTGPFLSAFLVTRIIDGRQGVIFLKQRIRQWKFQLRYYLFALILIPVAVIIGIILQANAFDGFLGFTFSNFIKYIIIFIVVFFGGGPLAEEPGWRGFALPRMQTKYGPLSGTIFIGLLWTFWHIPDFLTSAQGGGPDSSLNVVAINFIIFTILVVSISIILTWITNKTNGSILSALLVHTSVNTPQLAVVPLFPKITTTNLNLAAMIAFLVIGLFIVIKTKGKLGYI